MSTRRRYGIAGLLAAVGLTLAGCGSTTAQGADTAPAEVASAVQPEDGSPSVVTLSEEAEGRLGMTTVAVEATPDGLVVPYASVVYEADGSSWVWVRTEPLTYQRSAITISGIAGDRVTLSAGPPAGTQVVTVGAAELVGVEIGIDGEE
jgi:hypothetical protein